MSRKLYENGNIIVTRYAGPHGAPRVQLNIDKYFDWLTLEEAKIMARAILEEESRK